MRSVPFDHIKEVNEERYYELMEFMPHIQSFNIFMMAKNIGVTFSPSDLDIEQVTVFNTMYDELNQKAKGDNGRQPTPIHIRPSKR